MKERIERRVLGAIRLLDAVTKTAITEPLGIGSSSAKLTRNLGGLFIINAVSSLEQYTNTFDLGTLEAGDVKPDESVTIQGQVTDPTGRYLPRAFTLKLPRNVSTALPRPANSVFEPVDLHMLPAPCARVMAGWAKVRVAVKKPTGEAFPNVLVRVLATADNRVLGRGMSDDRGEALVAIPGLPLFQPGTHPLEVVTSETAVTVEFIPPGNSTPPVDWTELDAQAAAPANVMDPPVSLKAGETYSLNFTVSG